VGGEEEATGEVRKRRGSRGVSCGRWVVERWIDFNRVEFFSLAAHATSRQRRFYISLAVC
jgi:hypothetical protein